MLPSLCKTKDTTFQETFRKTLGEHLSWTIGPMIGHIFIVRFTRGGFERSLDS